MNKFHLTFSVLLLYSVSGFGQQKVAVEFPREYKMLGTLKTRTTHEIVGSDLGIGCEVLDRDYADYHAYKHYLDSLGAKTMRLQSGWAKTEKVKGQYDFSWLDAIVDDALSRRIEPWISISYGNDLYPNAGGISLGEGIPTTEEALEVWTNYTRALVNHFKGRVTKWEIWNEADHSYNDAGPEAYARLYYATAKAVREVQPAAELIGLALASVGNKPEYVESFFEYLKERNGLHLIDRVTFHGYPRNPDVSSADKLKATVYKYKPGLALFQGETGCPSTLGSSGALSGYPWSEISQAKWNLRRALHFVGNGYPYSLFTISEFTYDRKNFKGLNTKGILKTNDDLSIAYAKPTYYAYRNLTAVLDHQMELLPAVKTEVESDSSISVYTFRHQISKLPMVFLYQDGSIPKDDHEMSNLTLSIEGIAFDNPVAVDLLTGTVYQLPETAYRKEQNEARFENLITYDSPVMIVDRSLISLRD
ncbi:MAG: hypothetical protein AAF519_10635 [Bacteroidota bacterium]